MAKVTAFTAFDMTALNLNYIYQSAVDFSFQDNSYLPLNSVTYEDALAVIYDGGAEAVVWLGTGMSVDPVSGQVMAGTIQAIFDVGYPSTSPYYLLEGISLSAVALYNASLTVSTSDDFVLLGKALGGADTFVLSPENDRAFGYAGNDTMNGGLGNDYLRGDAGSDRLNGQGGADTLVGGLGTDFLNGGLGKDMLYGGVDTVRDVFIFGSKADSAVGTARDVIFNFTKGTDDINLHGIDANTAVGGNQDFTWSGTTAKAHGVWYSVSGSDLILKVDVNGDTTADFSILIKGVPGLTSGDVIL